MIKNLLHILNVHVIITLMIIQLLLCPKIFGLCGILYQEPETSNGKTTEINGELDPIKVSSQNIYDACYLRCQVIKKERDFLLNL